ncbi:MAG TPA: tetratricopeptide repeat protein [Roseiflexaceae bacterium]|nr:tetratricopeptide repeat protein [Roseiflexaceae bacterium]
MPIHLRLSVADGMCQASLADAPDQVLAETSLTDLPGLDALRRNPYEAGLPLLAALGGAALRERLERSPDRTLLLECDDAADALPWEYAALSDRRLLSCVYGLLRLVPDVPAPPPAPATPPRLLLLHADPLLYPNGALPRSALDFEAELRALGEKLRGLKQALSVQRLPPTQDCLADALADGPALLHLSCHGMFVDMGESRDVALSLEDNSGRAAPLLGRDLLAALPQGRLRGVLLSACQSAPLAHALVREGVPVALGMHHNFPDPQSGALAATFWRWLAAGNSLAEAMRQARQAVAREHPGAAGLLAVYIAPHAWDMLDLPPGLPELHLDLPMQLRLPDNLLPPSDGLLGRNRELVALAEAFTTAPVVTLSGAGGMGKTALAAAFARRFGWRFGRVLGVSFASSAPDPTLVCRTLLEAALAGQLPNVQDSAHLPALLRETLRPDDLVILDNYESVLTPEPEHAAAADAVAQLLPLLRGAGARLLLTSRAKPAGLSGEVLIPPSDGLTGLAPSDGAALFLRYASRSRDSQDDGADKELAHRVAELTGGYPLALALLGSAYDRRGAMSRAQFERDWNALLAQARQPHSDPRHASFSAALELSLRPLDLALRTRLLALSVYEVPFFAEGAALLWELPQEDYTPTEVALADTNSALAELTRRSLLEVESYFAKTDTPATYRFQPALRQELRQRQGEIGAVPPGALAYGVWLARRAYGETGRSPTLARLVAQSLPLLDAATSTLEGETRLLHIRNVAWLRSQFGELQTARQALEEALPEVPNQSKLKSLILHDLARIEQVQGDLKQALERYQDSLTIKEALQDVRGKAATLHEVAYIYTLQGDLKEALRLYQDSLAIAEALQDVQGKAATLSMMANIYRLQGDLKEALRLYQDSLAIHEALQDVRGKAATLSMMANLLMAQRQWNDAQSLLIQAQKLAQQLNIPAEIAFITVKLGQIAAAQGDLAGALEHYRAGLAVFERLGMPREAGQVREFITEAKAAQQPALTLDAQIQGWLRSGAPDAQRIPDLLALLNTIAATVVAVQRAGDAGGATMVASALVPLRTGLHDWPAAAGLPPFGALLGCFQALLRGQTAQLDRLRVQLDDSLTHVLTKTEQLIAADEQTLRDEARDAQIAQMRAQVTQAMQQVLGDTDEEQRRQFIDSLEQTAVQVAEGEEPGSPWLSPVAYLRACVALLRGEPVSREGLDAADLEQLDGWANPFDLIKPITAWLDGDDATRQETLLPLLNTIAQAVVSVCRNGDSDRAATLATALVPLRTSLRDWHPVAELLPFGVLLGCFQALLRREESQLTRLRAQLDEGLAQTLAQIEQLIAANEQTLRDAARDGQIAQMRAQVAQAMPQALADTDAQRRGRFLLRLELQASQVAEGEEVGSPWLSLAAFLRACAALLRGEPFQREGLDAADLEQLEAWANPLTLEEAITVWVERDDGTREGMLETLLNAIAQRVIGVRVAGDIEDAEALAAALVPLRAALRNWPPAADLPPVNALLGCFQALLRGQEAQLALLRVQLDERLAQGLAQVEQLSVPHERAG